MSQLERCGCIAKETSPLSTFSVLRLFREYGKKDLKPTLPPVKPKGGEVFLFYSENSSCKGKYAW